MDDNNQVLDLTPPDVTDMLSGWSEVVAITAKVGKRNRRMIRWLALSIVVDVILTFGLGWATIRLNQVTASAHTRCESGNVFRANNTQLWEHILTLPPGATQTAKQKQQTDDFRKYLLKVDAPVKCPA